MSNRPNPRPSSSTKVRNAQAAGNGGARVWWIGGIAAAVIVVLLIVAVAVTRNQDDVVATGGVPVATTPSGEKAEALVFGTVTVDGTDLPQQPSSGTDPAIGQTAPTVTGQKFDGSALTIPSAGKAKIVMLIAHWCPHCQKEVPLLTDYLKANGMPADVDLYAISTGVKEANGNYPPAQWLSKAGWPVPTMVDDEQSTAAQAYGLSGYPTFVVIGADGKVVDRQSGEKTIDEFKDMLAKASAGKAA